jgi:hypothetical protein
MGLPALPRWQALHIVTAFPHHLDGMPKVDRPSPPVPRSSRREIGTMQKDTGIKRVALGTSGEVVDCAKRQIFSSTSSIEPVPAGVPRRSQQRVLCELLDSEINARLQTFAFGDVRVWIGDQLNGREAEALLTPRMPAWSDDASIAHWLHETAIRLYPDSDYARAHR